MTIISEADRDAIAAVRRQLVEFCTRSDYHTAISITALVEALIVVITSAAPTADDAKSLIKGMLERTDIAIDAAWAARQ